MSRRIAPILALTLAIGSPVASLGQRPPDRPSIRWEDDPSGRTLAVSVVGLAPEVLEKLREEGRSADRWTALLSVSLDAGGPKRPDRPAMLGSYRIEGDALRFTPRYPLDRGRSYRATFRPSDLTGADATEIDSVHLVPRPARVATVLTRVDPSGDRVPENLLKFYLHFSTPMGRGEAYDHVRLLGPDGRAVDLPFLRLGEELWDPTATRLTLLIDPGRIKRGLRPREEHGPVLEAGRTYTLVVDPAWRDAEGDPLATGYRKSFRSGPADEVQPDPKTWSIVRPPAATREPLTLTFPEALDRAMLDSALTLVNGRGEEVDGKVEVDAGETRWRFLPEEPWAVADYQLLVESDLEDLAGNSIRRPFEVDVQRDTPIRPEATVVRLPIAIRPAATTR